MNSHAEAARLQAESDRERHQTALKDMRLQCDADVALAMEQARAAKEEAKRAMEYDRQRATRTVKEALASMKEDNERLGKEREEVEERLNREWASKVREMSGSPFNSLLVRVCNLTPPPQLRHLELKVKTAADSQKVAVERAIEKVSESRQNALFVSESRQTPFFVARFWPLVYHTHAHTLKSPT